MTLDREAVRLERVSFRYADRPSWALRNVSLMAQRGEMVVVMGATGAGKSTLAKCLNRIVPAFQAGELTGAVTILSTRFDHQRVADFAGIVGLVSQDFESQLFATNVVQEIAFGMEQLGIVAAEMRQRVPVALAIVGLQGFEGRDPSTLSGGEKQRLAIAATLAMQPSIIVFDEPTTDLDPLGKLEIFTALSRLRAQGYTLIVIEHETAAAELADRLVILSDGEIIADDHPAVLLADVALLEAHGIRPPDLSRLARLLEWPSAPRTVPEAEALLRARAGAAADSASRCAEAAQPAVTALPRDAAATPPTTASAALICAEALHFAYDSGQVALRGVNLSIHGGEFIALIGQNGSGKTTLAKHLNGLLKPRRGTVRLEGEDIARLPLNRIARHVGYVFQNPDHQIFAASVFDEVAFGPRNLGCTAEEVGERVHEALDAVALTTDANDDPFLLSKGHRKRLAVASVLAMRPRLLILDEPTTGLDYREQQRMMQLIAALHRRGVAILMITHSPWIVAEYAERALLMNAGEVAFDGSLRTLFADEALLEAAHFRVPDVTRLGNRLGVSALSVEELANAATTARTPPATPAA